MITTMRRADRLWKNGYDPGQSEILQFEASNRETYIVIMK